jgi:ribonuclease P protein component
VFSRKERLPRAQFGLALKTNRRLSSPHFLVLYPLGVKGYAIVIPKKVVKLSSLRHLLKRQISEAMRTTPLPPALLVFPRSSLRGVHYKDIQKELHDLISKI